MKRLSGRPCCPEGKSGIDLLPPTQAMTDRSIDSSGCVINRQFAEDLEIISTEE
jgi:hypothetical protein